MSPVFRIQQSGSPSGRFYRKEMFLTCFSGRRRRPTFSHFCATPIDKYRVINLDVSSNYPFAWDEVEANLPNLLCWDPPRWRSIRWRNDLLLNPTVWRTQCLLISIYSFRRPAFLSCRSNIGRPGRRLFTVRCLQTTRLSYVHSSTQWDVMATELRIEIARFGFL